MKTKHIIILFISILIGNIANAQTQNELNSQLFDAVEADSLEWVKELIENGAFVNAVDLIWKPNLNNTPIFYSKSIQISEFLIQSGARVEFENIIKQTPFVHFMKAGNYEISKFLFQQNADVSKWFHAKDSIDNLLFAAVLFDSLQMAQQLLSMGANPNATDSISFVNYKNTPMHYVKSIEMLNLLYNNKANLQASNNCGTTPLLYACENKNYELYEIVDFFLKHNVLPNQADDFGNTPLHLAAFNGYNNIIELLIQYGAEPKWNQSGYLPIHYAASGGNVQTVELLVNETSTLNTPDKYGKTPLMIAFRNNNFEVVKTLILYIMR